MSSCVRTYVHMYVWYSVYVCMLLQTRVFSVFWEVKY